MSDTLTGAVANIFAANPVEVITDPKAYTKLRELIDAETSVFVPDLSTDEGRKAIASLAYKVTRTKTAIDAARKELTEEWRAQVTKTNGLSKVIIDELDAIAKAVRKPLTEWEEAEEAREAKVALMLASLRLPRGAPEGSVAIGQMIAEFSALTFDPDIFGDSVSEAEATRTWALGELRSAHAKALGDEADRAELARLRAAEAERQREAKATADAEAAEQRAQAAAALADARRREAEDAAAAEREKDKAHRANVMRAAKEAIMSCGASEEHARAIVQAILRDKIPNVSLRF